MERNTFFCNLGLYIKSVLVFILLLGGSSSAWADSNTTVNDGTSKTSSYFPFYGMYANKSAESSQVIIPSGSLTAVKGCTISKIVFYTNNTSTSWGTATFKVYLKETDDTAFGSDALADFGTMTEVYSGSVSTNASKEMEITFDNGFAYSGKNLLVGFDLTNSGSSTGITCYGIAPDPSTTKNMVYKYLNFSNTPVTYRESFLPKMTIYYYGAAAPTSLTVNSSTYESATLGWTNGGSETQWQIVCSTTDNSSAETPTLIDSNPYTIEGLSENTTYYAFVRAYYSADTQSDWARISFTTPRQYPIPTDFSLTGFTATTASFTWTNGDGTDATAWIIKYSTTKGFDPDETGESVNVDTNPYTLKGLTEGTTYYARICADYGSSHYSSWNETEIEFTPSNTINTLVNNGTDKSYNLPIQGSSVSNNASTMVKSQYIIPSSSLGDVSGRQITKLTFYAENSSISWGTATFEVYLNEVSYTTFPSTSFGSWGTKVFDSASLSVSGNEMVVELNTPYNYNGGNLQIGFKQTGVGSNSSSAWLSVKDGGYANLAIYGTGTGSTGTRTYYAPKVTITSVPVTTAPVQMDGNGFTTFASPYALDLTTANMPTGLTAYRAAEVDAGNSIVRFTSDINQTVQANTGILLKGTANTTYSIPVVASGTALGDNALLVNDEGSTFDAVDGYTYFAMKKNSSPLTFGTFDPSTTAIPSNKAYLKVLTKYLPSGARTLRFVFDDNETTGIKNVDAQKTSSKDIYFNLNGQRVAKPTKGMYISNGKKYIVK